VRILLSSDTSCGQSLSFIAVNFRPIPPPGTRLPDYSFSPDLSFLNKKIELGFRARRRGDWCGEEQSTKAQVTNAGNIIHALTAPIHPNVAHGLNARGHPSGIG
jgi:hypothetical protein